MRSFGDSEQISGTENQTAVNYFADTIKYFFEGQKTGNKIERWDGNENFSPLKRSGDIYRYVPTNDPEENIELVNRTCHI